MCEIRKSGDSFSSKEGYKRGFFSKTTKNVCQDSIPLLPRSNNGIQQSPQDYNTSITKKALLVRHFKHSMDYRKSNQDERELLIYCKYCNNENCHIHTNLLRKSNASNVFLNTDELLPTKSENIERNIILDSHSKNTKRSYTEKKFHSQKVKMNRVESGIEKRKNSKNGSCTSNHRKSVHTKVKKPTDFRKIIHKVMSKSSTYSISVKGTNVNVEKIVQHTNRKKSSKIKTNRKEMSGDVKHKPGAQDQNNKKTSKSAKKKDRKANKETQEKNTTKSTQNSRRHFRMFRNLFSAFFKESKTCKSLESIVNDNIRMLKPPSKDKINYKRRKKKRPINSKSEVVNLRSEEIETEDETRKYRISAYLDDQDWMKRQCMIDDSKNKRKTEISKAVAVINSSPRNETVRI